MGDEERALSLVMDVRRDELEEDAAGFEPTVLDEALELEPVAVALLAAAGAGFELFGGGGGGVLSFSLFAAFVLEEEELRES